MVKVGLVLSMLPALLSRAGSWNAMDTDPRIEPGSALDLSFMNHSPAGRYGFVRINRDGDLCFEKLPGKTVRFYGTNNNWKLNTPTREEAVTIAERYHRLGYNIVRIHSADAMKDWCTGIFRVADGKVEFDEDKMDRFEFLLSEFRKRGIYVNIDIFHLFDAGKLGIPRGKHGLVVQPESMALWKSIARKWLTHVNPYTGLALKDDPMLVSVSFWNEGLLVNLRLNRKQKGRDPFYDTMLRGLNRHLAGRGIAPLEYYPEGHIWHAGKHIGLLADFYTEKTVAAGLEMKAFLKGLGVRAIITGFNYINNFLVNYWRYRVCEAHETHLYYQLSAVRRAKGGYTYNRHKTARMSEHFRRKGGRAHYYPDLALKQAYGMPFFLTEWQNKFLEPGREEAPVFVSSIGAYQSWDVLNRFDFAVAPSQLEDIPLGRVDFGVAGNPLMLLSEYAGALLFRKDYIKKGSPKFLFVVDPALARTNHLAVYSDKYFNRFAYVPHLFNTQTVFAKNPDGVSVHRLDPRVPPEDVRRGKLPAGSRLNITEDMDREAVAEALIRAQGDAAVEKMQLAHLREKRLVSDTGELVLDIDGAVYTIDTPCAAAASGSIGGQEFKLGGVTFSCTSGKGTFFIASLDDRPMRESSRLLLLYFTDVKATGEQVTEKKDGTVEYRRGRLPTLARLEETRVSVRSARAGRMRAYRLAVNGRRVSPVKVRRSGRTLDFRIDTSAGLAFELVAE